MSSPNLKEVQKQVSTWKLSRESPSAAASEDLKTEGAVLSVKGALSNAQLKTLTLTFLGHQA